MAGLVPVAQLIPAPGNAKTELRWANNIITKLKINRDRMEQLGQAIVAPPEAADRGL